MADVFEDRPELDVWRERLWALIAQTPMLDWLLLTKRPENIQRMVPWTTDWPSNVWVGISAENQQAAERTIPILLTIPAAVRFVSYEPALGPIAWNDAWAAGIDWIIVGGESGNQHRPFDMAWARTTRDWCQAHEIAFFFKQDADRRNERRSWVVEPDGSRWQWHQYPGNRCAPVRISNAGMEIAEHILAKTEMGYICEVCGLKWTGRPYSKCIGVPVYPMGYWPEHLLSKKKMYKAGFQIGRNLPPPAGAVMRDTSPDGWMLLYDKRLGVPRAASDTARAEAFRKTREKSRWIKVYCDHCGAFIRYARAAQVTGPELCSACQDNPGEADG
jgi:hypothetical protein